MDECDEYSISTSSGNHHNDVYDDLRNFSKCVDLLLACVYAPGLQSLTEIVSKIGQYHLSLWTVASPHLVGPLCELVLKGLEYDPCAIDVLTGLSRVTDIRNVFLEHKPQLLHGLIKAALVNERTFSKYTDAILSLMLAPLPSHFIIPANAHTFVVTMAQAVIDGDTTYLSRLESICRHRADVMDYFSSRHREGLVQHLKTMLNSATVTNWVALSCLASLSRHTIQGSNAQRDSSTTRSIFDGEKGKKVLRLVLSMLNSQLSCDEAQTDTTKFGPESALLQNILLSIDTQIASEWLSTKDGASLLKKITDKIPLMRCSSTVQDACRIVFQLHDSLGSSETTLSATRSVVCERALHDLIQAPHDPTSVELLCYLLSQNGTSEVPKLSLMTYVLTFLSESVGQNCTTNWSWTSELVGVQSIVYALKSSQTHKFSVAEVLFASQSSGLLNRWTGSMDSEHQVSRSCPALGKCNLELCTMIIELQSNLNLDARFKLSERTISEVLRRLIALSSLHTNRRYRSPEPQASSFFCEATDTPQSGRSSQNWQTRLLDDLQRDAQHQYTNVITHMNAVCRDLEIRATINEEPLRQAEARLELMKQELTETQTRLMEASLELQQRDTENLHVFEERQRLENVIANLLHENENGNTQLKALEQTAHAAQEQNALLDDKASQLHRMNLELRKDMEDQLRNNEAAMSDKNLIIVNLQNEIVGCNAKAMEYKQGYEHEQALTHSQEQRLEDLKRQLQMVLTELSDTVSIAKQHELAGLETQQRLQSKLEHEVAVHSEAQECIAELKHKLDEAGQTKQDLLKTIEEIKALADEQMTLQEEKHSSTIRSVQDELAMTKDRAQQTQDGLEQENASLRQALTKIKTSYERRCIEFEQAKDLSKRLMAVTAGAFSQSSPMADRRLSSANSEQQALVAKRHKSCASTTKKSNEVMSDSDLTIDVEDPAEKENRPPSETYQTRRSFGRDDSAVLSQLSGLGI